MTLLKAASAIGATLSLAWLIIRLIKSKRKCLNIRDKTVLITGASSGLGEACAHAFYAAGCKVIISARRVHELERVKAALQEKQMSNTHEPVVVQMDLSQLEEIPKIFDDISTKHGQIDIVINNAGVSYRGEAVKTTLSVDQTVMQVNYFGQLALTKAALVGMLARKQGCIVCISSLQGKMAIPFRSAYAASKHALQAWCDSARAELAGSGVQLSVYSPGYINTSLSLNSLTQDGSAYAKLDATTASGMSPHRAAAEVLQLCVQRGEADVLSAPLMHRAAILLRTLLPQLFFFIMVRRAAKQRALDRKAR